MTRLQTISALALLGTPTLLTAQTQPVLFPPYVPTVPQPNYTEPPPPPVPPAQPGGPIPGTNIVVTPITPPASNPGNQTTISPGQTSTGDPAVVLTVPEP